jgi:hypothetical protein
MQASGFVKLNYDMKAAQADLSYMEKEHFPMAYTWALTRTAQEAQEAVRTVTRSYFHLHSEFVPRGIRVQSANVRDLRDYGIAESAVFTAPIISGWMPLHEEGGDKVPRHSNIAIPSKELNKDFNKTATGKIKNQLLPKALLAGYVDVFRKGKRVRKNVKVKGNPAFIITSRRTGTRMIVRRLTNKKGPLEVLYIFKHRAHINAEWDFEKTVRTIANFRFEPNFKKAFTAVALLSRP